MTRTQARQKRKRTAPAGPELRVQRGKGRAADRRGPPAAAPKVPAGEQLEYPDPSLDSSREAQGTEVWDGRGSPPPNWPRGHKGVWGSGT